MQPYWFSSVSAVGTIASISSHSSLLSIPNWYNLSVSVCVSMHCACAAGSDSTETGEKETTYRCFQNVRRCFVCCCSCCFFCTLFFLSSFFFVYDERQWCASVAVYTNDQQHMYTLFSWFTSWIGLSFATRSNVSNVFVIFVWMDARKVIHRLFILHFRSCFDK